MSCSGTGVALEPVRHKGVLPGFSVQSDFRGRMCLGSVDWEVFSLNGGEDPRYEEGVVQSDAHGEEPGLMALKLCLGGMVRRMPAGEIWCPSCWTRGLHSLSAHLPDFALGCTQWSEGQERAPRSGVTAEYHLRDGRLGSSGARGWEVSGGLGSPVVCGLSCPHRGRAL